ncbi:hypothetical protein NUW54_g14757 [Trametes sanguinea]|uniref:Uncharacterized protein n=1 Tax=Trametes sanguinea TaxID=158606 RepID=A0ACC1MAN5_9APHY|nr:hypothetical protein NUW54_g14757 [Trametes sanguinea]
MGAVLIGWLLRSASWLPSARHAARARGADSRKRPKHAFRARVPRHGVQRVQAYLPRVCVRAGDAHTPQSVSLPGGDPEDAIGRRGKQVRVGENRVQLYIVHADHMTYGKV